MVRSFKTLENDQLMSKNADSFDTSKIKPKDQSVTEKNGEGKKYFFTIIITYTLPGLLISSLVYEHKYK